MLLNTLVVAATLLSSVSAIPVAEPATGLPNDGVYRWKVSNWKASCGTKNDCQWEFDIAGDDFGTDKEKPPSFAVKCRGDHDGGPIPDSFDTCSPDPKFVSSSKDVASRVVKNRIVSLPSNATDLKSLSLQVTYEFVYSFDKIGGTIHNVTSPAAGTAAPITTTPSEFIIDNIDPKSTTVPIDTTPSRPPGFVGGPFVGSV